MSLTCSNLYVNVVILMWEILRIPENFWKAVYKKKEISFTRTRVTYTYNLTYINIHGFRKSNVNSLSYCYCTFDHGDYVFFIKMQSKTISKSNKLVRLLQCIFQLYNILSYHRKSVNKSVHFWICHIIWFHITQR